MIYYNWWYIIQILLFCLPLFVRLLGRMGGDRMDIAVIGASGDIGRHLVEELVLLQLLRPDDRLILGGRKEGTSSRTLYGLRSDLEDAYMEILPRIDITLEPQEIYADIVVMCAGITFPKDPKAKVLSRQAFTETNSKIFDYYAAHLAKTGKPTQVVIHISNPAEIGVEIFCRRLPKAQVLGMAAHLDSMRFRREIALALGVSRSQVEGLVVGEHGPDLIPLWSTVHIHGLGHDQEKAAIERLQKTHREHPPATNAEALHEAIETLIHQGPEAAFALINQQPFDMRPVSRPFTTHYTGAKTTLGPAAATADLIATMLRGEARLVSVQAKVQWDCYNLDSVLGVPAIVGPSGIERFVELPLYPQEFSALQAAAERINAAIKKI